MKYVRAENAEQHRALCPSVSVLLQRSHVSEEGVFQDEMADNSARVMELGGIYQ
jgi:hypothetical protein